MHTKFKLVVAVSFVLLIGVVIATVILWPSASENPSETAKVDRSALSGVVPTEELTLEECGYKIFGSIEKAEEEAGFKANVPTAFEEYDIECIAVGTSSMGEPEITISYKNGARFSCYKTTSKIDYAGWIQSMEETSAKASVKPTALPHLVTISGHQGMLWPPHMNVGDTKNGPIEVFWSDGSCRYDMLYPRDDFSEEEAIAGAESAYRK